MSREILFRGKRVDNGEWIEGNLLTYPSGDTRIAITVSGHKNPAIYGSLEFVIPETVGQYTGLTDKNGKKIFEGDIVTDLRIFNPKTKYVCVFQHGSFGLKVRQNDVEHFYSLTSIYNALYEVVGNVHDNSELLEEVKS